MLGFPSLTACGSLLLQRNELDPQDFSVRLAPIHPWYHLDL